MIMQILGPIFFGCFIIFGLEILYHKKKDDHRRDEARRRFWDRESEANDVRRQDITFLNYIPVKTEMLPMEPADDSEITEYQNVINDLKNKRILDLKDSTNTELKLQYGPANLPDLCSYEENFILLINTLTGWANRLVELDLHQDAIKVLEYGISIGSDSSRMYCLLAAEYNRVGTPEKISALINRAESLNSIMKKSILKKLKEIQKYSAS